MGALGARFFLKDLRRTGHLTRYIYGSSSWQVGRAADDSPGELDSTQILQTDTLPGAQMEGHSLPAFSPSPTAGRVARAAEPSAPRPDLARNHAIIKTIL